MEVTSSLPALSSAGCGAKKEEQPKTLLVISTDGSSKGHLFVSFFVKLEPGSIS